MTEAVREEDERGTRRRFEMVTAFIVLLSVSRSLWLLPWEVRHLPSSLQAPVAIGLFATMWLLPVGWYLKNNDPRGPLEALGLTRALRPKGLLPSVFWSGAYLGGLAYLFMSSVPAEQRLGASELFLRAEFVYLVAKAVLEEVALRGFVLGQLMRFTTSARAQVMTAVLFAMLHLPGWIVMDGWHVGLVPSTLILLVMGGVLGGVACACRSILPAIIVHSANNLLATWLGMG